MPQIKSINKGHGQDSEFYSTEKNYKNMGCYVDKIECIETFSSLTIRYAGEQ